MAGPLPELVESTTSRQSECRDDEAVVSLKAVLYGDRRGDKLFGKRAAQRFRVLAIGIDTRKVLSRVALAPPGSTSAAQRSAAFFWKPS